MKNYFLLLLFLVSIIFSCSSTSTLSKETSKKETASGMENVPLIDQLRRYPGLRIRGNQVYLNGISSINTPNEVLFIVNGAQVGNFSSVPELNPQAIKRIEVLKNPADFSQYGMMGSGGVILITTY
jgi:TonB-dependent SusC/RagA subfamily outer membrane receptor|tara:strand:+ start:26 stop:403 length:378 start_codon:yes stop_codon:yes gene_type:complete